jgi:hypothetical protein
MLRASDRRFGSMAQPAVTDPLAELERRQVDREPRLPRGR